MSKNNQPNQKMGRRPKQTFFQRRHTDGQQAHEKILSITNYYRNANQNQKGVSPHTGQNGYYLFKSLQIINVGEDVEKMNSCMLLVGM